MLAIQSALFLLCATRATAVIIAKSTLNQCFQTDSGLTGCTDKLAVALTVENGENATSSIELSILSTTVDGEERQISNKQISIVLRKTPVYFYYPTTYYETYNYQPWEQLAYGSTSGSDFVPFNDNIFFGEINSCIDGDNDESPSCGFAYDDDGSKIPSSQGKCCKCTVFQLAGFDNIYMTRSNLQCGLDSAYTQSSHCLRFDPLWYHTYIVGTATTFYSIQVETHYCDKLGQNCNITAIVLSPNTRSGKSDDDLVYAELVGDLATFEEAPSFESTYLVVPSGLTSDDCNGLEDPNRDFSLYSRCVDHLNAGPDYYMFVPQSLFGAECNKIGVSYSSFRFQSDFCTQEFGSCTESQLADLFQEDQDAADSGATGRYWAKNQGSLGLAQLTVEDSAGLSMAGTMQESIQPVSNADASLVFQTDRFQTTLLVLELDADDITYVVCLGTAKIDSAEVPIFESNSNSGSLRVTVKSTSTATPGSQDDCNAAFVLEVDECSSGVVPAVASSSIDLAAGQSVTKTINIKYEAAIGLENLLHNCTLNLFDAYANKVDSLRINFETTATVTEKPQGNDCLDSSSCGNAVAQGLIDPCECQWYEFSCIMDDWDDCASTFWNFIIVIGCVVGVLGCCCIGCCALGPKGCVKCLFLPCRLLARCCSSKEKPRKEADAGVSPTNGRRRDRAIAMPEIASHGSGDRASRAPESVPVAALAPLDMTKTASLLDNKLPSPVNMGIAQRTAIKMCGTAYFNIAGGTSADFPALVQPGPQFSLRGYLRQIPPGNMYNFEVLDTHGVQYIYYDEVVTSFVRVAPPRKLSAEQRQLLGGDLRAVDVVRFVSRTPQFAVLNETPPQ